MDLLRLPSPLRSRVLTELRSLSTCRRSITTQTRTHSHHDIPPPSLEIPSSSSQKLLTLTSDNLNSYAVFQAPNQQQLKYSNYFFHSSPPNLLFSAAHFRSFPPSSHPEVAFLGRSNVGKSSLLNALFGRPREKFAYVSKKPGKTQTMNGFGVGGAGMGAAPQDPEARKEEAWKRFGRGGVVVVDMPGYGSGSREQWGKEAMKFLEQRKQLRRTFVLIDSEHGLKSSDIQLLAHLRRKGIGHTVVLSKVDKILYPSAKMPGPLRLSNGLVKLRKRCDEIRGRLSEEIDDGRDFAHDILCCSAEKSLDETSGKRNRVGIDELRWAVLSSCGLESDQMGQKRRLSLD